MLKTVVYFNIPLSFSSKSLYPSPLLRLTEFHGSVNVENSRGSRDPGKFPGGGKNFDGTPGGGESFNGIPGTVSKNGYPQQDFLISQL